tara:strand:+ start:1842 stop:2258 length:417 start_codon:yes stop_codon:yes gene_type:complete
MVMRNNIDPVIGEMDAFSRYAPQPAPVAMQRVHGQLRPFDPRTRTPRNLPKQYPPGHDVREFYPPQTHPEFYDGTSGFSIDYIQDIWNMYLNADEKTRRELRDPNTPYSDYFPAFYEDMIKKSNMMTQQRSPQAFRGF